MIDSKNFARKSLAGSALLLATTFGLGACSSSAPDATATIPAPATAQDATATIPAPAAAQDAGTDESAKPAGASAEAGKQISVKVVGEKPQALLKTLVVTSSGTVQDGEMSSHPLPYERQFQLKEGEEIAKILVLAKYPDGQSGTLGCDLGIDGVQVASDTSTSHRPAKCLVVK